MPNNAGSSIIDVRTKEEFEGGHYPGAIHIPLDEVVMRIHEIKKLCTPIIAYCRIGNRSALAVALLTREGIRGAINGGGVEDMFENYPINQKNIR